MGVPKYSSEGGSGGRHGHSGMEHWGYTDEVKLAAKRRRRLNDKSEVKERFDDLEFPAAEHKPSESES